MGASTPTFVVDRAGRTRYGSEPVNQRASSLAALAPSALAELLTVLPKANLLAAKAVTVPGFYRGRLALFAAAAIVPSGLSGSVPPKPRYIVMVRIIDRATLARWGADLGLDAVRWAPRITRARNEYAVRNRAGAVLRVVTWDEGGPGERAVLSLLPLMVVAAAIFLLLATLLSRLILKSEAVLREQTRLASLRAEEQVRARAEALAAQADAEEALAEARMAKAESERLAVRQRGEEARHKQHLRHQAREVADRLQRSVGEMTGQLLTKADDLEESARRTLSAVGRQEREAALARTRSQTAAQAVTTIADRAGELMRSSSDIKEQTGVTRRAMGVAGNESAAVQEANARLQAQVEAITSITNLINGLASKTNLVALNATIEAARAGEQGRGFAIVAGEVKELAGHTGRRTAEIHALVEGVKGAAVVNDMLVESLHGFLQRLGTGISATASAVDQQQYAASAILEASRMVGSDAQAAHVAVTSIAAGLALVSADATSTQRIGAEVRGHVTALSRELDQMLTQLRSA